MVKRPKADNPHINTHMLLALAREHTVGSVDEVAAALRKNRSTIVAAAERGDLPSLRVGKQLVFPLAPLLALLGLEMPEGDPQESPTERAS